MVSAIQGHNSKAMAMINARSLNKTAEAFSLGHLTHLVRSYFSAMSYCLWSRSDGESPCHVSLYGMWQTASGHRLSPLEQNSKHRKDYLLLIAIRGCNKSLFLTVWQNTTRHETTRHLILTKEFKDKNRIWWPIRVSSVINNFHMTENHTVRACVCVCVCVCDLNSR